MLAGAAVALALAVPATPAIAADHTIKIAYETSETHLEAAFAGSIGDTIRDQLAGKGLKALGFWYETPTHLFTTEKSVTSLAALNGMKIRTYPSALLEQTLDSLGAVPTVIPGSEVYLALENGVAQGALTTPSFAHSIKLTDSLKHMTRINLAFGGYIMAINAKFHDSLPADLREAVGEAAARATAWNREAIVAEVEKSEQLMLDAGVVIHDLDEGDRPSWVNAIQPVVQNQEQALQDLAAQAG